MKDKTYHDDETLFQVGFALQEAGLNDTQISTAVASMMNRGILFREQIQGKSISTLSAAKKLFALGFTIGRFMKARAK